MTKATSIRAILHRVKEDEDDDPLEVISPSDYVIPVFETYPTSEILMHYCIRLKKSIKELTSLARAVECRTEATLIKMLQNELIKSQTQLHKMLMDEVTPK